MESKKFKTRWLLLLSLTILSFSSVKTSGGNSSKNELKRVHALQIQEGKVPEIKAQDKTITTHEGNFVDASGRTMFLRGINLGGSTKVPYSPNMASHVKDGFFNGKEVSFVGRPFPIEDADIHFKRLKAWGYHFLRFLVTWEAIEHEGPGIYDKEYLAYVKAIVSKANEYGINVMIDPHQDVWSRFSGGDGAPLWTFEIAGMDATKFQETGAAFVHNIYGDPYPQMIWFTNYFKLAPATMFTLFYGGNDFAPKTKVDGVPIQDFLQQHYINALVQVARELKDLPNVIGFELMNEPSAGYIGVEDLTLPYHTEITGNAPTPWQGILLGEGVTQKVKRYKIGAVSLKSDGEVELNTQKASVWKNGQPGIWVQNGVAEKLADGSYKLKDAAYFSTVNRQKVDFNKMYYEPFAKKYVDAIHQVDKNWIICVDNTLFPYPHGLPDLKNMKSANGNIDWVDGSHWYDDVTLVKKKYMPYLGFYEGKLVFGTKKVQKAYEKTMANMIAGTKQHYGNVPSLLGEFGIPYDMNKAKAYRTGNFSTQAKALDRSFRVAEKNLLNYTLWNYTADNTNQRGDNWNGEDLSIFSLTQQTNTEDINSGGRALDAAVRPFPKKVAGKLLEYSFNYKTKKLVIRFNVEKISDYPTEIFLPEYTYGNDFTVSSKNTKLAFDKNERTLLCYPETVGEQTIVIN